MMIEKKIPQKNIPLPSTPLTALVSRKGGGETDTLLSGIARERLRNERNQQVYEQES